MSSPLPQASNIRMNQAFSPEGVAFNIKHILKIPETLQFPASFYERLFDEYMREYESKGGKLQEKKEVLKFIIKNSEAHRNKIFENRKSNPLFYNLLFSLKTLSDVQVEQLFEDIVSPEFDKRGIADHLLNDFIRHYMDKARFYKYVDKFERTDDEDIISSIKMKAIEFLELNDLAEFIIRNKKHEIFNTGDLLFRNDIDWSFYEKIKINKPENTSLSLNWLKDIIRKNEVIKMNDPEQLKRIAVNEKDSNILLAWAKNPHVSEEGLLVGFRFFKNDLNDNQNPTDYANFLFRKKEFIVAILEHSNCPDEIFHDVHEILFLKRKTNEINEELAKEYIAQTFVKHAPIDLAIDVLKKYHKRTRLILPELIERLELHQMTEAEQKKVWPFLFKIETKQIMFSFYDHPENQNFWDLPPKTLLDKTIRAPLKINNEALFGLYARKDISHDQRKILFNEIESRLSSNQDMDELKRMNWFIFNVFMTNDTLPPDHVRMLKNFFLQKNFAHNIIDKQDEHLDKETREIKKHMLTIIQNGLFQAKYFSLSEIINLLSRMESKDLKMNLIEYAPLPQNIRRLFDEPDLWQNPELGQRQENTLTSSPA